jgi:transcriptional regulator with XRE-family HTH domain
MQQIYERLGKELRRIRQKKAMTQSALSELVGFSRVSIVNIEAARQRIQLHDIENFARVLGVPPGRLLCDVWSKEPLKIVAKNVPSDPKTSTVEPWY